MLDEVHPASGVGIQAWILPSRDFSPQLPEVAADAEGRFKIDLLPGCRYSVIVQLKGTHIMASIQRDLSVEPGQILDLGELILDGAEFVPIKVEKANKN